MAKGRVRGTSLQMEFLCSLMGREAKMRFSIDDAYVEEHWRQIMGILGNFHFIWNWIDTNNKKLQNYFLCIYKVLINAVPHCHCQSVYLFWIYNIGFEYTALCNLLD